MAGRGGTNSTVHSAWRAALLLCAALASIGAVSAEAHGVYDIDLPRQGVADALRGLSEQTGVPLVFPYDLTRNRKSHPVSGRYTVLEALDAMLEDTGLSGGLSNQGVLTISLKRSPAHTHGETNVTRNENGESADKKAQGSAGIAAFFASILATFSALAQDVGGGQTAAEARNEKIELEEVIVTAQKRAENLQEVPTAISVFSADMIESRGITKAEDLQYFVPGLNIGVVNRDTSLVTLRGVGLVNQTIGGDPGVTSYVDGHYIQSTASLLQDFLDVDRIEVQRGPQGTLYGRNSIGGNINIITKRPTKEFEGMASIDVGNYNKRLVQGVISGPFSDRVRGRLAASQEKRDGYVNNTLGTDLRDSDYYTVRSSFEVDFTDSLQGYFSGSYYNDTGNIFAGQFNDEPPDEVAQSGDFDRFDRAKNLSADFTWQLGGLTFRSLSSYNDTDYKVQEAIRVISAQDLVFQRGGHETYAQEFQLLSPEDTALKWIAGLFLYDEKSYFSFELDARPTVRVISGPNFLDATSWAAFGQIQYALNPKWELVAGLRYSNDEKEQTRNLLYLELGGVVILPGDVEGNAHDSWDAVTYVAGLNYHIRDDVMLYASISNGYRAGGYNDASITIPSYAPEYVKASEIGLKSEWLEQRLQLNLTAFHYDYTDKQEVISVPISTGADGGIQNATSATVDGVELEVRSRPTRGLTVDASLAYLDGSYDDFQAIDPFYPELGVQDITGNPIPQTTKWKWSLGAQYDWSLAAGGSLNARADYSWQDEVQCNYFNRPADLTPSAERVNARLQWQSASSKWTAELYGLNLTDEHTVSFNAPLNLTTTQHFYLPPRTYGVKVRYEF